MVDFFIVVGVLTAFVATMSFVAWCFEQDSDEVKFGPLNTALLCPHCQARGHVRAKQVEEVAGISGPKAVGAIATGGLSALVTGVSRRRPVTKARCGRCTSTWTIS